MTARPSKLSSSCTCTVNASSSLPFSLRASLQPSSSQALSLRLTSLSTASPSSRQRASWRRGLLSLLARPPSWRLSPERLPLLRRQVLVGLASARWQQLSPRLLEPAVQQPLPALPQPHLSACVHAWLAQPPQPREHPQGHQRQPPYLVRAWALEVVAVEAAHTASGSSR